MCAYTVGGFKMAGAAIATSDLICAADRGMYALYRRSGLPLWVSPTEAQGSLVRLGYSQGVALELRDWVSRVLSNAFVLGFLAVSRGEYVKGVSRLNCGQAQERFEAALAKMGYCEQNAQEIARWMAGGLQGLYDKGAWYGRPKLGSDRVGHVQELAH